MIKLRESGLKLRQKSRIFNKKFLSSIFPLPSEYFRKFLHSLKSCGFNYKINSENFIFSGVHTCENLKGTHGDKKRLVCWLWNCKQTQRVEKGIKKGFSRVNLQWKMTWEAQKSQIKIDVQLWREKWWGSGFKGHQATWNHLTHRTCAITKNFHWNSNWICQMHAIFT